MKSKRWKRRNKHTRPDWVDAYDLTVWFNQEFVDLDYPKPVYIPVRARGEGIRFILTNTTPQHHQR